MTRKASLCNDYLPQPPKPTMTKRLSGSAWQFFRSASAVRGDVEGMSQLIGRPQARVFGTRNGLILQGASPLRTSPRREQAPTPAPSTPARGATSGPPHPGGRENFSNHAYQTFEAPHQDVRAIWASIQIPVAVFVGSAPTIYGSVKLLRRDWAASFIEEGGEGVETLLPYGRANLSKERYDVFSLGEEKLRVLVKVHRRGPSWV